MKNSNSKNLPSLCERGVAMLECCIVLPLLVLMVVATYDLGGALNEYLLLTRASYEGARYAAVIPGLEQVQISSNESYEGAGNHAKVRDRVRRVLEGSGFSTTGIKITTSNENDETVRVTVERVYVGHFGFFPDLTIRVSATGPFLSKPPV